MDAVCNLKPQLQTLKTKLCIVCHEKKNDALVNCGSNGLEVLKKAAETRDKLLDVEKRAAIDRISVVSSEEPEGAIWYHKCCYSTFTSKTHIQRLERKRKAISHDSEPSTSEKRLRRSCTSVVNWAACIFCQNFKAKQLLRSITTFKMSSKILDLSQYDQTIHVRLSGIGNLIAAEGKYHPNCLKRFERNTIKVKETAEQEKIDIALQWLTSELRDSAKHAHVLQLSEVFNRYSELAERANVVIPASFVSRRATFKEKLQVVVEDLFDFVSVPKKDVLLVPRKFRHLAYRDLLSANDDPSIIPKYQPLDDEFLKMVHVALKLRGDILSHPKHTGFVVTEEEMIQCVPTRLFMFIRLMFGGHSLLEGSQKEAEDTDIDKKGEYIQTRVLRVAQDLMYNVTGGRHWTPKHIGLASTLHQATRSKELVQLFHNAGHVISYHSLLQVDTALAEKTLQSMDPETGAVTPPNFVPGRFTHFTCDNIDINDSSLDGKNTFHAMQVAGWQRGPEEDMMMKGLKPSQNETLRVPNVMEEIFVAGVVEAKVPPGSTENTKKEWFKKSDQNKSAKKATAQDMAFALKRQDDSNTKEGWTSFNKTESNHSSSHVENTSSPVAEFHSRKES